jgi:hypothetical protein
MSDRSRDELGQRLRALAQRLDRLRLLNHDPEFFHIERDEIRHALMCEADALSKSAVALNPRGRFETGALRIGGRASSEIEKVFR